MFICILAVYIYIYIYIYIEREVIFRCVCLHMTTDLLGDFVPCNGSTNQRGRSRRARQTRGLGEEGEKRNTLFIYNPEVMCKTDDVTKNCARVCVCVCACLPSEVYPSGSDSV